MQTAPMRIKDVLQKTTQFFREKGIETARLDTELLLATALNWERVKLYLNYEYPLSPEELNACRDLVRRRAQGEPIAYILGKKDFFRHSFTVSPAVLIPRPETEILVEEALAWLNSQRAESGSRIIDFGTGSGCIGLSLLAEVEDAKLVAIDKSPDAIDVAALNAEDLGVAARVTLVATDVADLRADHVAKVLQGMADLIVANPPYIAADDSRVEANVRKFEPEMALFSGADGLGHIRVWTAKAAELVRVGGLVIFEIGSEQGRVASEIFAATGRFDHIEVLKDLAGHDRFVRAIRAHGN